MTKHAIVFLDIDGVLNSSRYYDHNDRKLPMYMAGAIDREAVEILNTLVRERTNVRFVLSSAWRQFGKDRVFRMLESRGFEGEIIDVTPANTFAEDRWAEIDAWLRRYESSWDCYVVLDDSPDAWSDSLFKSERGMFASCNHLHGLVAERIPSISEFIERMASRASE